MNSVSGVIRVPGDKSISHRYAMLASIAEGASRIANYSSGADCQSTLTCIEALGIRVSRENGIVRIEGKGLDGLRQPEGDLDAGNSGSTIRMLSGILAAQPFTTRISGDDSLCRRPMQRIMKPLLQMGARIEARDLQFPPLAIEGARLQPIEYHLPVASAQVKTCVLFAGLFADGRTAVYEPAQTRDHTELALEAFGVKVERGKGLAAVKGRARLVGRELTVPGDLSSAAFFLVAALALPHSRLVIEGVGLNPTRSALLDFLMGSGASIRVLNLTQTAGEIVADIVVTTSAVRGGVIEKGLTAALIDEIPVLAVLGAVSEEGLTVRDASELRVKETDRIATVAENLRRMGIAVEVSEDGFQVPGRQKFQAAEVDSFGDHRIAMAFSVAALLAGGECKVRNAGAAAVSYPEFFDTLRSISTGDK
ncbi:MAG TPA: 3-phosphoshikimate 1-carboxyvinyltransferase [Bryobacteraceae bacterium]|nr:3-phosphoshikimate 1-carboxyvinyltransferase [Bryobacteraceae bacterium]